MRRPRGFTLIEMVMVIVVASIGAVALLGLFGQSARSLNLNEDVQTAAQLAQECGEHIFTNRRRGPLTYATIDGTVCAGFTAGWAALGFDPPLVTMTDPYAGAGCPAGANCKLFVVDARKGGATRAQLTLMLAN